MSALAAQRAPQTPSQRRPHAAPSRADSLLAVGRLAAAEEELYAAVGERPRAPEARGALGAYLASRGRFRIAEILLEEAMRFGADSGSVRRAIARMAPYRARVNAGDGVAVPYTPNTEPNTLGSFEVSLQRGVSGGFVAQLDPSVTGIVLGRRAAESFGVPGGVPGGEREARVREVWIGELKLEGLRATVDTLASPGDVRIGLDVLWPLHLRVDERVGMLVLGRPPQATAGARVERIPFVLTFPGLLLVMRPGEVPHAMASREGRALLRGSRWQIDAAQSTVVIERLY